MNQNYAAMQIQDYSYTWSKTKYGSIHILPCMNEVLEGLTAYL